MPDIPVEAADDLPAPLLTIAEVAALNRIPVRWLYDAARKSPPDVPCFRFPGRKPLFSLEHVEEIRRMYERRPGPHHTHIRTRAG